MIKRVISALCGGALISIFAGVANIAGDKYISPLLFMTGIILIIVFRQNLVTRDVPLAVPGVSLTILCNFVAAGVVGVLMDGLLKTTPEMRIDFPGAVMTGIIIGFVALVNVRKSSYTIPLTALLMYAFVFCGFPHCVVYAFDMFSAHGDIGAKVLALVVTLAGNIVGGLLVRWFDKVVTNERR